MPLLLLPLLALAAEDPAALADALVAAMRAAEARARTYTFTLERWEVVDGVRTPNIVVEVRHRKPDALYARWVGDYERGQEVLYLPKSHPKQFLVNPTGLIPPLWLELRGAAAMRANRHSVDELGFPYLVGRIAADHARLQTPGAPAATYVDLGLSPVAGRPARCYRATLPRAALPSLYADQVEVCVDEALHLPTRVDAWDLVDGRLVQVEHYVYRSITVNPPLTDLDFDPANPAYNLD